MCPPEKPGMLCGFDSPKQNEDKRNGNNADNKQTKC